MDDLDRLYFEFVEIVRRERPGALNEALSVLELCEDFIPYRRVRNLVGFRSNDDYEFAVSRLLAGERGFLIADAEMQRELREGLDATLPDTRKYRSYREVLVRLNPEKLPPPGHTRYAPPELREQAELESQAAALAQKDGPEPASPAEADPKMPAEMELEVTSAPSDDSAGHAGESEVTCSRCEAALPDGALFCPFCGRASAAAYCPSCGAELDTTWRYCARCGTARESVGDGSA